MDPEFWNQRFGGETYYYGTAPNEFLAAHADLIPPGPVLCLGEGEGRNAVFLAARGHAVTAVDQSSAGLAKARRLAADRGVELATTVADLGDFAIPPGAWSAIVSIFVHLPQPLRRELHRRAAPGLVPGGVFILEGYTPAQVRFRTGGPVNQPELLMRLADLRDELAGLDLLVAREIERDVSEGTTHCGHAAVVQLVARRRA
ncbi:MAG TPA: class I SAM-dependent methyltransferase [Opitutus sp.]|nr:class I SAM-dependent methyltransferase [Opitutus sp.]